MYDLRQVTHSSWALQYSFGNEKINIDFVSWKVPEQSMKQRKELDATFIKCFVSSETGFSETVFNV